MAKRLTRGLRLLVGTACLSLIAWASLWAVHWLFTRKPLPPDQIGVAVIIAVSSQWFDWRRTRGRTQGRITHS